MEHEVKKECACSGKCCGFSKVLSSVVLAAGLAAAGFFPGYYYYQSKFNYNTVSVKGLSEMDVRADLAVWDLKFVVTGSDIVAAQQEISAKAGLIKDFLLKQGFQENEINLGRIDTNDLMANPYRNNELSGARYILNQTVSVRSQDVDLVEKSIGKTSELIRAGIIFDSQSYGSPVSYIFTKLNEIKPQMLEEATKNAEVSAQEFAKSSGSKVGKIRRASQGVFSILPREQTAQASEMTQINKKVRVVSTVEYWLD